MDKDQFFFYISKVKERLICHRITQLKCVSTDKMNAHNKHFNNSMRACKSFGFMTKGDANEKDDLQMLTSNGEISSDISTKNRMKNKTIITNTSIIRYIQEKFRKYCF